MTRTVGAAMDIRFGTTVEDFIRYVTDIGLNHVEFKHEYLAGHPETPDPKRVEELSEQYGVSVTYHAPFRDWNVGSYDEVVRQDSVERVKRTLDAAAAAGAEAVVVHGGSGRVRRVRTISRRPALSGEPTHQRGEAAVYYDTRQPRGDVRHR
jgi:sugar phosphate isomerase/epimerase